MGKGSKWSQDNWLKELIHSLREIIKILEDTLFVDEKRKWNLIN
jgi:hypothetical protein